MKAPSLTLSSIKSEKKPPFFGGKNAKDVNTFFKSSVIQPKLTVGESGDKYEQEADKVAQQIGGKSGSISPPVQHKIQRKATSSSSGFINNNIESKLSGRGNGSPMSSGILQEMEAGFGASFKDVRVHTDQQAINMNRNLGARAFAHGSDIYFNKGMYNPGHQDGKKLLAHELTHTIQQKGASPMIQRDEDPRITEIKERLKRGEKLTEEDIAYVKQQIGNEMAKQILAQSGIGQIIINYDSSRKPEDVHRRFHGKLDLKLSGVFLATASSLEGTATSDIDLDATLASEKAIITLSPPTEDNRLSAMIRELLFPNNNIITYDFDFPKEYFKYANAVDLLGAITLSLTGPDTKHTGGMIKVSHASVPNGVELIMTLSSTARDTSVADTQREVPGNHWILTPNPRLFGTIGYSGLGGSDAFGTTLGADFPLAYDTSNPLIYAGLGVRGTFNSGLSGSVGGNAFVGLNFDPLLLQAGIGAGAAFLPKPIDTPDGPAQTFFYTEVEGMAAYRVITNLDLVLLLSAGGGKDMPAYGTAQLGAGYHF